ncbi:MAG: hypothetical protein ABSH20_08390 [Tepidisphaeraceae bacterium]
MQHGDTSSASQRSGRPLGTADYSGLPLIRLIELICDRGDTLALHEFHQNRSPFRRNGTRPLRLGEYVATLQAHDGGCCHAGSSLDLADCARDLTIDRFLLLPGSSGKRATDCRNYFAAFLTLLRDRDIPGRARNQFELECMVADALEPFVLLQFMRSLLECRRKQNPTVSRYFWKLGVKSGETICVLLPQSLARLERQEWLERNIRDVDPARPGERERIQSIVNQRLVFPALVACDDWGPAEPVSREAPPPRAVASEVESLCVLLAPAVAEEKLRNLHRLRPAIREMGRAKVRELILAIFESIRQSGHRDKDLAQRFGLDESTYSRFAGSDWRERPEVPDLWLNTAQLVLAHRSFADAAKEAGVWQVIRALADRGSAMDRRKEAWS